MQFVFSGMHQMLNCTSSSFYDTIQLSTTLDGDPSSPNHPQPRDPMSLAPCLLSLPLSPLVLPIQVYSIPKDIRPLSKKSIACSIVHFIN